MPISTISGSLVWARKKCSAKNRPKTAKARKLMKARNRAWMATRLAFWKFFSPRLLERVALMPTPVPVATAIIRFCAGKARDTAVRAFSLIWATNMLSTML